MSNTIQRNKMYDHITIVVTQFVAIVLLASAAMLPFATAKAVLTVCISSVYVVRNVGLKRMAAKQRD